jgi:hypothetical protein
VFRGGEGGSGGGDDDFFVWRHRPGPAVVWKQKLGVVESVGDTWYVGHVETSFNTLQDEDMKERMCLLKLNLTLCVKSQGSRLMRCG